MADIGAQVGIGASAIYWHFPSKQALLVALFDQCLDRLEGDQLDASTGGGDAWDVLRDVTRLQIEFAVRQREMALVYYREAHNLPAEDLRRLRDKQRDYVDRWAHLVVDARPDVDPERAETLVHAAIGAIQSCLAYRSALAASDLETLLGSVADAALSAT
jgi:AcrR family transcriptional regulator